MANQRQLQARITELEAINKAKELELVQREGFARRYYEQLDGREKRLLLAETRVEDAAAMMLKEISTLTRAFVEVLGNSEKLKSYKEAIKDANTCEVKNAT